MKGDDPSSFMIFARPMGGRPLFVFQVSPNTNENWFKVMGDEKRGEIMRGEGCTLRFLGFEAANGFSTDAFVDDYVFNMEPVIYNNREAITNFFNQIVSEVWRITGNENLNQYSVTFGSPIEMQLAEYKARANGNQQQTQSIPVQIGNGNS